MKIVEIQDRFDRVSADYEAHDALEREVGERLLQRVAYLHRRVACALDVGCGTGRGSVALKSRFPDAKVVSLDLSGGMLAQASVAGGKEGGRWLVQGDLGRLPFPAGSADLIYCNLALQWAADFGDALVEWRRVLRPDGMLLFSVPGPESFRELRHLAARGMSAEIPIYMPDLRDVGDLLVSTGFSEPVMDTELIMLTYPAWEAMARELSITGGAGFADLPGIERKASGLEISFEVVYGTAFGAPEGRPVRSGAGEIATFSVEHLKRK